MQGSKISQLIKKDFYIDDFYSGADTIEELRQMICSVTKTLNSACFPLRKFRSNVSSVFQNESSTLLPKNLDVCSQSSALGLEWDPVKNVLRFPVSVQFNPNVTKRSILSNSAKFFGPLRLLSPCTIIAKMILQKLWLTKLDWDTKVDSVLEKEWCDFVSNFDMLSSIEISRY